MSYDKSVLSSKFAHFPRPFSVIYYKYIIFTRLYFISHTLKTNLFTAPQKSVTKARWKFHATLLWLIFPVSGDLNKRKSPNGVFSPLCIRINMILFYIWLKIRIRALERFVSSSGQLNFRSGINCLNVYFLQKERFASFISNHSIGS